MYLKQKRRWLPYVDTDVAMKLTLNARPNSVEELKIIMQEKFKPRLDNDFSLQYVDPDFEGQLTARFHRTRYGRVTAADRCHSNQ
jgi:hypothetical protein